MLIAGEWLVCDDEVTRPVITALVVAPEGQSQDEAFLVDSGADKTVFRAALMDRLQLPMISEPAGFTLTGIGGSSAFVPVMALLEFTGSDGRPVRVRGRNSVFINRASADMSILGRDVLDNFDLIVSRQHNEVLLLAPNHRYQIVRG